MPKISIIVPVYNVEKCTKLLRSSNGTNVEERINIECTKRIRVD